MMEKRMKKTKKKKIALHAALACVKFEFISEQKVCDTHTKKPRKTKKPQKKKEEDEERKKRRSTRKGKDKPLKNRTHASQRLRSKSRPNPKDN